MKKIITLAAAIAALALSASAANAQDAPAAGGLDPSIPHLNQPMSPEQARGYGIQSGMFYRCSPDGVPATLDGRLPIVQMSEDHRIQGITIDGHDIREVLQGRPLPGTGVCVYTGQTAMNAPPVPPAPTPAVVQQPVASDAGLRERIAALEAKLAAKPPIVHHHRPCGCTRPAPAAAPPAHQADIGATGPMCKGIATGGYTLHCIAPGTPAVDNKAREEKTATDIPVFIPNNTST